MNKTLKIAFFFNFVKETTSWSGGFYYNNRNKIQSSKLALGKEKVKKKLTSIFEIFLSELLGDVVERALCGERLEALRFGSGSGVRKRERVGSMAKSWRMVDERGGERRGHWEWEMEWKWLGYSPFTTVFKINNIWLLFS